MRCGMPCPKTFQQNKVFGNFRRFRQIPFGIFQFWRESIFYSPVFCSIFPVLAGKMISNPNTLQTIWDNRTFIAYSLAPFRTQTQIVRFFSIFKCLIFAMHATYYTAFWIDEILFLRDYFFLHVCRFQLVPNWLARSNSLICAHSANGRNLNSAHTSVSRSYLRLVYMCVSVSAILRCFSSSSCD